MATIKKSKGYLGNQNLKQENEIVEITFDQQQEYAMCMIDPIYFITKYVKIVSLDHGIVPFQLYEYQKRFIMAMHENRKVIGMMPRQMGKTTTAAAYLCWYLLFSENEAVTVAILANKASAAREIMSRLQQMYEALPKWMQKGVKEWNKGSIELASGARAFTAATSASGIRGKSCVTADTKICVDVQGACHYTEISNFLNNRNFIEKENMKYTVYQTTNKLNGKIYCGYHSIGEQKIISMHVQSGSCFSDGYMGSGKIILDAIKKYGPENFKQDILAIFDSQKEAEDYEAFIVNQEFTLREDTYNIAIGGNVRTMVGENNGFYGRRHSDETKKKIIETRTNTKKSGIPVAYQMIFEDIESGEIYKGFGEVLKKFNFVQCSDRDIQNQRRVFVYNLVGAGKVRVMCPTKQQEILDFLEKRKDWESKSEERKDEFRQMISNRFSGKKRSPEAIQKSVDALTKWREENPDEHSKKMLLLNKDPVKIEKTAAKHRGMQRSEQTKKNISDSKKGKKSSIKGRVVIHNSETQTIRYIMKDEQVPDGWVLGVPPKNKKPRGKSYTNGIEYRIFQPDQVPDGWVLGGAPKRKQK